MAELDGLLNMIPIGDIAKKLGIDENVAKAAVSAAVPVIVAGMAANAQDKGGAKSLAGAATRHAKRGKQFSRVDDVDTVEGDKIASNVFGSNKPAVEKEVAKASGIDPDLIAKIVPIVAPIIIAFIGNMLLKKQQEAGASGEAAEEQAASGGGIGDLLGGLLGGGGSSTSSSSSSGGGIGDLLGGLLGGGGSSSSSSSSGGSGELIGQVLGGLLGGGKK
jgi:hypothetical protein